MKSLLFAAAFSLILVSPSWAQIEIRKARFGQDDDHRDVRGIVNEFIREGRLSFRVTSSTMGGDVTPRTTDYFYVVYKSNGQEYTQSVAEGDVFTFKGVNTRPVVDPEPVSARLAPVQITNDSGRVALAYSMDRKGRWVWKQEIAADEVLRAEAPVGQQWKFTNRRNEQISSFTVRAGRNVVRVGGADAPEPAGQVRLKFKNNYGSLVYVYKLDRWSAWTWVSQLDRGATYSANAGVGERWILTDNRGRVVRELRVARSMNVVEIDR